MCTKLQVNCPSGYNMCCVHEWQRRTTRDRTSSPQAFVSGELKIGQPTEKLSHFPDLCRVLLTPGGVHYNGENTVCYKWNLSRSQVNASSKWLQDHYNGENTVCYTSEFFLKLVSYANRCRFITMGKIQYSVLLVDPLKSMQVVNGCRSITVCYSSEFFLKLFLMQIAAPGSLQWGKYSMCYCYTSKFFLNLSGSK
jgi:hypothetical protein